jgi:hypothetical protein
MVDKEKDLDSAPLDDYCTFVQQLEPESHFTKGRGMSEVTYYPAVQCEVQEVVPPLDRIAEVTDIDGRLHQINVPRSMIKRSANHDYLPIGIVEIDRRTKNVLIEFPVESGQGTNRAWVTFDQLWHEPTTVAV